MQGVVRHVFRASAVRVVGLAAKGGNQGGFVLLHHNRSRGDVAKEFFRHFRGHVRYEDQGRICLISSVGLVLTGL